MKHILILAVLLTVAGLSFSQDVIKLGTVKGKNVTYKVRESAYGPYWVVRNVHNPDTVIRPKLMRSTRMAQEVDITMQIAEIVRNHLTAGELDLLAGTHDFFSLALKIDSCTHKIMQVSYFSFQNKYAYCKKYPEQASPYLDYSKYNGFWLNFDPDRLHEIEKDIIKRVEVPERIHRTFLTDEMYIALTPSQIINIEESRREREKAVRSWKENDRTDEEIGYFFGPTPV